MSAQTGFSSPTTPASHAAAVAARGIAHHEAARHSQRTELDIDAAAASLGGVILHDDLGHPQILAVPDGSAKPLLHVARDNIPAGERQTRDLDRKGLIFALDIEVE
ncbi:MAG: hypothetical protein HC850_05510, partial [Rhodomicrobium sp.]|nr:hypothetical protein [Rhodomicrobium sp.]